MCIGLFIKTWEVLISEGWLAIVEEGKEGFDNEGEPRGGDEG